MIVIQVSASHRLILKETSMKRFIHGMYFMVLCFIAGPLAFICTLCGAWLIRIGMVWADEFERTRNELFPHTRRDDDEV